MLPRLRTSSVCPALSNARSLLQKNVSASLLFCCSRSSLEEYTHPTQDCSVERFFQGSLLIVQQDLHRLQWSRSAERLSFKTPFSSMQQALVSCSGSFSGKVFLSRLYPIQGNKPSSAAVDSSAEMFSLQGSLLFNAKCSSSAAFDSFSRKLPFFKALSLQYKKPFTSCL